MKNYDCDRNFFFLILALAAFSAFSVSCDKSDAAESGDGELRLYFSYVPEGFSDETKSLVEIPDTNDFLLDVRDESGEVIYNGKFGDSPESIRVSPGSYTVKVVSGEFNFPAFSKPQFGDEQCIVVEKGGIVNVALECRQLNSGIRLNIDKNFLTEYPEGVLFLRSSSGSLMYGYSERRIAYFKPGNVSLVLSQGAEDKTLFTRVLGAQEILVLDINVSSGTSDSDSGISILIDTSRIWLNDEYLLGSENGTGSGSTEDRPLSVNQAKESIGAEDVWVKGYIVGGDLTSSSISFSTPFSSATNLAIAARSSASSKESCMSVSLPSGKIRDALNLVDRPQLLGRQVCLKGDIVESYFGIPGLKNVSDYTID